MAVTLLNSGKYGIGQIGKVLVIYTLDETSAFNLAKEIHNRWYSKNAPKIVNEFSFCKKSCVYLRYGAFTAEYIENAFGFQKILLKNGQEDKRGIHYYFPKNNHFKIHHPEKLKEKINLKKKNIYCSILSPLGKMPLPYEY